MCKPIKEIIGAEEEKELRTEFMDLLSSGDCRYSDVEDLLLDYGLEMDYFEQLCF